MKERILTASRESGHDVRGFGACSLAPGDDYPDFVIPLARAAAQRIGDRAISICGSVMGASYAANNGTGLRTALIHKSYFVHQGVEDDDMNLLCPGGRVVSFATDGEIIQTILHLANLRLNDLSGVWRKWLQSSARSR